MGDSPGTLKSELEGFGEAADAAENDRPHRMHEITRDIDRSGDRLQPKVSRAFTQLIRASVLLALGCTGCAALRATLPRIPPEIAEAIPQDARAVKIYSDQLPADYYLTIYQALVGRGFEVNWWNRDREARTLSTEFKDVSPLTALKLGLYSGGGARWKRSHSPRTRAGLGRTHRHPKWYV